MLLHGWPYDIHSYAEVTPLLAAAGYRVIVPYLRGYGTTRFRSEATFRNGQQSALAVDVIALMDALGIDSAIIAGFDWGARTANVVAALWPERCKAMVSVSGYLIGNQEAGQTPLPPAAELPWWYQFYFATERGRAGYDRYRHDFAKLIWHTASPRWELRRRDVRPQRSVVRQPRPRRHRHPQLPMAARPGARRAASTTTSSGNSPTAPAITVPTITLEGDANGAPHPDPSLYADEVHRQVHAPAHRRRRRTQPAAGSARAFADAIVEVGGY